MRAISGGAVMTVPRIGLMALVLISLVAVSCTSDASDDSGSIQAAAAAKDAAEAARAAANAAEEASTAAQQASVVAHDAVMAGESSTEDFSTAVDAAKTAASAAETAASAAAKASEAAEAAATAAADQASELEASSVAASAAAAAAQAAAAAAQRAAAVSEDAKRAANAAQAAVETLTASMTETEGPGRLVVYSGRSESLVGPIIDQFRQATGVDVQVKYGGTSAMAATLLEEGENSPADVFWAQDPGALGALSSMFKPLPSDVTLAVPEWARAEDESWVGITGRARVLVYNTDLVQDDLPASLEELTDPKWKGRIGWPPTNASFRIMVTAMRHLWGEEKTPAWLEGMLANDVQIYPKNTPIVDAAGKGEVDIGLVNHYYLHRFLAEHGDGFGARNLFLDDGGPGSLIMVAGAGILRTSSNPDEAERFVRFLLSKVAQQYFAASVYEYPLVEGVKTHHLLPPIESLNSPDIEFALLDDLVGTEALLRQVGAIP